MLVALVGCGSHGSASCSGECTAAQYCDPLVNVCAARVTEFVVGGDAGGSHNPHAIVADPHGYLWFTETEPSAIGRLTIADGTITEFATPTPNASPIDLALGASDYIWFLEGIGAVGLLTPPGPTAPDGAITEYPFGVANNGHIAANSTGAAFTVDLADEVGFAYVGGISTFTAVNGSPTLILPGPDKNPWIDLDGQLAPLSKLSSAGPRGADTNTGLVAAEDGDLYIIGTTQDSAGSEAHIGRWDTGNFDTAPHQVATFKVPKVNAGSDGITFGPDDNIWFTEPNSLQLGRLEIDVEYFGRITEFPVPSSPAGITRGPDGNIWFTEPGAGKIARFVAR
jgi:virginiamycin B lyase